MCKYNIYVSSNAKQDLLNIGCYVTNVIGAQIASNNLLLAIDRAIFSLEKNPKRCPKVSNSIIKKYGVRKLLVKNYIIFFRVIDETNSVQILRVLYARRNLEKLI